MRNNRREFFNRVAAAAAVAGLGVRTGRAAADLAGVMDGRMEKAYAVRLSRADYFKKMGPIDHPTNGDEDRYPSRIASFSKTLLHNQFGEVSREAYTRLLAAIQSGRAEDFENMIRGGTVRLKNPAGALTFQLFGADQSQYTMPPVPSFDSAEQAAAMVELYWQSLTRDVPFAEYDTNPLISAACDELSKLNGFRGPKENGRVTPRTVFRGHTASDLAGPYISQFLLQPFKMGHLDIDQKQRSLLPRQEFMTTEGPWLEIQMGIGKGAGVKLEDTARYVRNGRDLANVVHLDWSYSPFTHALWLLLSYGAMAYTEDNPYVWSKGQEPYINFGPPDAFDFVARAAKPAFNAAWFQKWHVHRAARPEAFGGRIHFNMAGATAYPIHPDVLNSRAADMARSSFGTYLLAQAYSEGCPPHSTYPSGHATVSGAVVTMLKAFFRESFVIPDPVTPSADGLKLEKYTGGELTTAGELNKLAFNIAMGRNWAGIHWRYDAWEGMKLGEQVAINILRDAASTYPDSFGAFHITRFDGSRAEICADC